MSGIDSASGEVTNLYLIHHDFGLMFSAIQYMPGGLGIRIDKEIPDGAGRQHLQVHT